MDLLPAPKHCSRRPDALNFRRTGEVKLSWRLLVR